MGRLMLKRIKILLEAEESFAFETTLSTRSYVEFIEKAKELGYQVTCLFFWLDSEELAISRVETRLIEGGHFIPEGAIRRRYTSGLNNFFNLFIPRVDNWLFVNNSGDNYEIIAEGALGEETVNNSKKGVSLKENIMDSKEQLKEERDRIVKGLEETYKRLVEYKKQKKSPMIVTRNGKIEAIDPNEIPPTTLYKRNAG